MIQNSESTAPQNRLSIRFLRRYGVDEGQHPAIGQLLAGTGCAAIQVIVLDEILVDAGFASSAVK
jgi:hypothetical protein